MIEQIADILNWGLGLDAQAINVWQMGLRAVVIYLAAVTIIRLGGDRRFTGKHAAIDVLLGVILGSTLSRAINGSAPYFETLGAALVLVCMHWLLAAIAFRFERFDTLIKGRSRLLLHNGQLNRKLMQNSHISQKDLEATSRLVAKLTDLNQVEVARLERSGQISVIPKDKPPQIIEVTVEAGVQTVRIQLN